MEENAMPKTKGESIFFTAITAWMMVYVMTLYNTVIAMGSFTNAAFLIALKGMMIEYHHHRTASLFRIRPSCKNVRFQSSSAW